MLDQDQVPAFKEFGLSELRLATKGFSSDLIVSESGEKAPNVVYRGKLEGGQVVAIKRFSKQSWPDAQQFVVRFFENFLFLSLFFLLRFGFLMSEERERRKCIALIWFCSLSFYFLIVFLVAD